LEEQYMDEEEFFAYYEAAVDNTVSTLSNVGIRCSGAVSLCALQRFLGKYLEDLDVMKDFMRTKGVFNIMGSDKVYVMQCVHMLKNEHVKRTWGDDETRENRIIFIGQNMQERRQELTEGFKACIVAPLRFPVGCNVWANSCDGYRKGTVIKHWDEHRAYRIRLDTGEEVWGPIDEDDFVKEAS